MPRRHAGACISVYGAIQDTYQGSVRCPALPTVCAFKNDHSSMSEAEGGGGASALVACRQKPSVDPGPVAEGHGVPSRAVMMGPEEAGVEGCECLQHCLGHAGSVVLFGLRSGAIFAWDSDATKASILHPHSLIGIQGPWDEWSPRRAMGDNTVVPWTAIGWGQCKLVVTKSAQLPMHLPMFHLQVTLQVTGLQLQRSIADDLARTQMDLLSRVQALGGTQA